MPKIAFLFITVSAAANLATASVAKDNAANTEALKLSLVSGSPAAALDNPSAAECMKDINASAALIKRVYPGYHTKLTMRAPEIRNGLETALKAAANIRANHDCDPVLFGYLQSFHEGHIFFLPTDRGTSAGGIQAIAGDAPSARSLSKDTFYLRIPSFFPEHRVQLEALLKENADKLNNRPFLVIDIRGNHGGADDTYEALLSLIATGPIRRLGTQSVGSPEIAAAWARALPQVPVADKKAREEVAKGLTALRAAQPGHRVTIQPDVTIVPPIQPGIRRVAILIDKSVASSGEQFLIDAKQSAKVVVIGGRTSGTLDYGDVRPFPLPSGARDLWLPTTSSMRLPAFPIDEVGITPDIPSALTGNDLVSLAVDVLERRRSH